MRLVEQRRPELAELIDRELDRQLEALVAERIVARNGHDVPSTSLQESRVPSTSQVESPGDVHKERHPLRELRSPLWAPS
jgi:hypothetical protein